MLIEPEILNKIIYRILFLIQRIDSISKELHELEIELVKFLPRDEKTDPIKPLLPETADKEA